MHTFECYSIAQCEFKSLQVHWIVQITLCNACCCTLHQIPNQHINRHMLVLSICFVVGNIQSRCNSRMIITHAIIVYVWCKYPTGVDLGVYVTTWRLKINILLQIVSITQICMVRSYWLCSTLLCIKCKIIVKRKWSFRRFTYGNLVTTSPSSKWQGLHNVALYCIVNPMQQSELFTGSIDR